MAKLKPVTPETIADHTYQNDVLIPSVNELYDSITSRFPGDYLVEFNVGEVNIRTYTVIPQTLAFSNIALRSTLNFAKEYVVPPFISVTKDGTYRTAQGNKTIASATNITTKSCSVDLYTGDGSKLTDNDWNRVLVLVIGKLK